jgi:hypothetical protein
MNDLAKLTLSDTPYTTGTIYDLKAIKVGNDQWNLSGAASNMVTTDTAQTITGVKTFSSKPIFSSGTIGNSSYTYTLPSATGTLALTSDVSTAIGNLATVASTGSYNDLSNKPVTSPLYKHVITLRNNATDNSATAMTTAEIITSQSVAFSVSSLAAWLYNNGYRTTANGVYPATGGMNYNGTIIPTCGIRSSQGTVLEMLNLRGTNAYEIPQAAKIIDKVTSLADAVGITVNWDDIAGHPERTVLFNTTPTSGTSTYTITLNDDITKYDEIKIYYNVNDDTIQRWCAIFPDPAVGNKFNITCFGNGTTRLYTKNTVFEVSTTTSLTLINSAQQRIGNNEATVCSVVTNQFHCRPYKIIGIKY